MNLESIQGAAEFLQKVYSFYLLQFEYLVLPASFRREASLPEAVSYERDDLSIKPFGSHVNDVKCRST
jgi:hypothetical protein